MTSPSLSRPPAGPFGLSFTPSGTDGYTDLARNARIATVEGIETPLADLADVVRSKRAANRPKDLEVLPALEEALRRRDDQIVPRNGEAGDLTVSFEIKVVGGEEGKLLKRAKTKPSVTSSNGAPRTKRQPDL